MSESVIQIGSSKDSASDLQRESIARLMPKNFMDCITTKLGAETEFIGQYKSRETNVGVLIEGTVEGGFSLGEGSILCIDEKAKVENGILVADSVLIAGTVNAQISCRLIELLPTAIVKGNIKCSILEIHAGAKVRANIEME